jgi:hypothetical protein
VAAGVAPEGLEAYLGAMRMFNLGTVSPMAGFGSFIEYWRQPTPYRWQILGLSVALTFTMMVLFVPKTERAPPEKMQITYIASWPEGRSDKEIIASNIANQKRKDAEAALEARRVELRKEFYRKLARASGMDPDKLAREFGAEETAPAKPKAGEPAAKPAARAQQQPTAEQPAGTPAK